MNFPKQFYKHYKGGVYEVISFNARVVKDLPSNLYYDEVFCKATFEHNLEKTFVYEIGGSYQIPSLNKEIYSNAFVLYKSVANKDEYWLRPFQNFMETIDQYTKNPILRFRRLKPDELLEDYNLE